MNSTECLCWIFLQWFSEELSADYRITQCCSNCDSFLTVYKKFNLDLNSEEDDMMNDMMNDAVEDSKDYSEKLEICVRRWFHEWLDKHLDNYDFALLSEHIISKRELTALCQIFSSVTDHHLLTEQLQSWPIAELLENDLDKLVKFIIKKWKKLIKKSAVSADISSQTNEEEKGGKLTAVLTHCNSQKKPKLLSQESTQQQVFAELDSNTLQSLYFSSKHQKQLK